MRSALFSVLFVLILILTGCVRPRSGAEIEPVPAVTAAGPQRVKLRWKTETETECYGYFIYRAESPDGTPVCLNQKHPLPGAGTTTVPHVYVYYDLDLAAGKTYYYRVKQMDNNGTSEWIIGNGGAVPANAKPLKPEEQKEIDEHGSQFGAVFQPGTE